MSSFPYLTAKPAPIARSVAIAALLGATILATPLTAARADTGIHLAQVAAKQQQAAANPASPAEMKGQTVEQRITDLHGALKITPDQEPKWKAVAQSMRENATNMDALVATTRSTPPQNMTAVQDLKTYQKFAQAHVDGLKNLIGSFETLYSAMPDPQKKIADTVFDASETKADAAPAK